MVEIELNAGSKGSKMSDVIFFSSDLQINQQFFSSIKPKKLEKGCPNYNCFNQNIFCWLFEVGEKERKNILRFCRL